MDLAPNNNKDWFDANRQRYLKTIKAPFEAFVAHLISKMDKDYPLGDLKASDCIFRINKIKTGMQAHPIPINPKTSVNLSNFQRFI
jgi:uncharacterized protein (DUF2461 family)